MKKLLIAILSMLILTVFSRNFLMIYPNGSAIKGESISVQSEKVRLEIPESWISDSFVSEPYPTTFEHVVHKAFDYATAVKESVGGKIRWRFEDGTIKQYHLLLDDPLLLSDENGVFSPKEGTLVFEEVQIQESGQYLDLTFPAVVNQMSYSYMFKNLSYSTVYVMNLDDDSENAEIVGTLIIKNTTKKPIKTENLYIFSGEINTISTDFAMNAMRSFNYEADTYNDEAAMESFSDYKIYSIPGSYSFNKTSTNFIQFLQVKEAYDKIYTFNAHYNNRDTDFRPLDQTIKMPQLSQAFMAGKIRIQKTDEEKTVFLGENKINNSSKGQPLEISFGKAYDLQGKIELLQSNRSGNTSFEAYKFTAKNYSTEEKAIQLNFTIPRDSDVEVDRYEFLRPTATLLQIPLQLHGDMEAEVTFEIRYNR